MSSTRLIGVDPNFLKAGEITREVRKAVEAKDWRGKTYLEIVDFVEQGIRSRGGTPSFPCNVCEDSSAAHNTAEIGDTRTVGQNSLLKVDFGASVDGYPTDTSITLCYKEELIDLAEATKSALTEALKGIKTGSRTSEIGRIVESYASRRGYLPISNLSGHSLDRYIVHAGASVPNVWSPSPATFKERTVYAVEPFFTLKDGSGIVVEGRNANIFSIVSRKRISDQKLNRLFESIWNERKTLPFAARWFEGEFSKKELDQMLKQLEKTRLIRSYPELIEAKEKPVAQSEHTIVTTAAGVQIIT